MNIKDYLRLTCIISKEERLMSEGILTLLSKRSNLKSSQSNLLYSSEPQMQLIRALEHKLYSLQF